MFDVAGELVSRQFGLTGLLMATAALLGVGAWVTAGARRRERHLHFGLLIIWTACWLLALAFSRTASEPTIAAFWLRAVFFLSLLMPIGLVPFALTYLPGSRPAKRWSWVVYLLMLPVLWLAYFSDQLMTFAASGDGMPLMQTGWGALMVAYALLFIIAIVIFLVASRLNKELDQTALAATLTGSIVSVNSVFSMLYGSSPMLMKDPSIPWLSIAALVGGLVIMALFVLQDRVLVDLRLVGVQAVTFLALFLFIADFVATAESPFEFFFRLAILLLLVIYGALTARAFVQETKRLRDFEALQQQIVKANGRLIEADRIKTRFVSFVAHQLKAPIFGIHGYLTMAKEGSFGNLPPQMNHVVDMNIEALDGLIRTIQTFLNITRIEMGGVELFKSETSLAKLINRAVSEVDPLLKRKGLMVNVDIDQGLPLVYCDGANLFHVVINLFENAIKYTEHGGITVRARRDGDSAVVTVTDTGIGLTEQDRRNLFNIFERGVSAVNLQSKGEGLGLYIAKQFVTAHGGTIFCESEGKDKGSTFGFRIPIGKDNGQTAS